MKKKVFLATNNGGKIERFTNLLSQTGLDIEVHTIESLGVEVIDVVEDRETLEGNAEKKAQAYFGKVDMPILANDTGLWVDGEGFVEAPKRKALEGADENTLTKDEIAEKLLAFWKNIATKNGGEVDAAWIEAFVLLDPDGKMHKSDSRREILLTDQVYGDPHIQMPVRCLYLSKTTNKPSIQHTKEEELEELQPIVKALVELLA